MDFSSDILIDFGLNLAGYLIVGLLVHQLLIRRLTPVDQSKEALPATTDNAPAPQAEAASEPITRSAAPEFIFLAEQEKTSAKVTSQVDATVDDAPAPIGREATRRADRRAICREAKRLLAKGKSQGELMQCLHLTENEVEMLSAAGKA